MLPVVGDETDSVSHRPGGRAGTPGAPMGGGTSAVPWVSDRLCECASAGAHTPGAATTAV
ncbi:hypothetical protein ACWD0Z_10890 [Streptomyces sp. NPDC003007]